MSRTTGRPKSAAARAQHPVRGAVAPDCNSPAAATRRLSLDWAVCLALVLSVFAAYAPVAGFDFISYDDPLYVTANPHVQSGLTPDGIRWALTAVVSKNWMPVTLLSHMLDVQLFGMRSGMHHLVNVAIHGLAAVFLFLCLRRAAGSRGLSAFVAFVFALHPLHVGSVAWIAERKDVLSAFFWFVALFGYLRYTERPSPRRYLAMAFPFCLGLLSKPMLVTFPFTLWLLDLWPLRRPGWPRTFVEKLPLFALSAAASVVTYLVQGSSGAMYSVPPMLRTENAIVSYVTYIAQTLWPVRLAFFYPYPQSIPAWQPVAAFAVIVAISFFTARAWRSRPWLTVGWFWYLITLLPVIGFVQVGMQAHADRYMYIPMIGLLLLLARSAQEASVRWPAASRLIAVAGIAACVCCLALARVQTAYWQNSETLYRRAIEVTENDVTRNNLVAEYNLAQYLTSLQRYADAVPHFEAALRIRPDYAEAHSGLGIAMMSLGDSAGAVPHLLAAVVARPGDAAAQGNLAVALSTRGDYAAAIPHFEAALRARPDDAGAHTNLGMAMMSLADYTGAIPHFAAALRATPDHAVAHYGFGVSLFSSGDYAAALPHLEAAIRARPDYLAAHYYRGLALSMTAARAADAIASFQAALPVNPDDPAAHAGYGGLLAGLGRTQEAIVQLEASQRLRPNPVIANMLARLRGGKP